MMEITICIETSGVDGCPLLPSPFSKTSLSTQPPSWLVLYRLTPLDCLLLMMSFCTQNIMSIKLQIFLILKNSPPSLFCYFISLLQCFKQATALWCRFFSFTVFHWKHFCFQMHKHRSSIVWLRVCVFFLSYNTNLLRIFKSYPINVEILGADKMAGWLILHTHSWNIWLV